MSELVLPGPALPVRAIRAEGAKHPSPYREVFTDDVVTIGPEDKDVRGLEAVSMSCGILVIACPDRHTASMVHVSLGNTQEQVDDLIDRARLGLSQYDAELDKCTLRAFRIDEMVEEQLIKSLGRFGLKLPLIEYIPEDGIRVYKDNGRVGFFTRFPSSRQKPKGR